ncbi:MAG: TlpA family protein disulfide reductase [Sphingobacteriaceae bacterium]|nr:MAG: TlpA family protein disulfide reductase [Sphingobacteriaceae bacterium]
MRTIPFFYAGSVISNCIMKKVLLVLTVVFLLILGFIKFTGIKIDKVTIGNKALVVGNNAFEEKFINKPLPAFKLKDVHGNLVDSKKLLGKIVHINFWSVYCVPCIKEFADLNRLKSSFEKDVVFIAIAPETAVQVNRILINNPFNYIIIPDAGSYFKSLGIKSYPKTSLPINKGSSGTLPKVLNLNLTSVTQVCVQQTF